MRRLIRTLFQHSPRRAGEPAVATMPPPFLALPSARVVVDFTREPCIIHHVGDTQCPSNGQTCLQVSPANQYPPREESSLHLAGDLSRCQGEGRFKGVRRRIWSKSKLEPSSYFIVNVLVHESKAICLSNFGK